ncbi:MAG: NAD-dependent succinate-semialdehyde dehydrogenase [Gallionella sp.]
MPFLSRNPATDRVIGTFGSWDEPRLSEVLDRAQHAQQQWAKAAFLHRAEILRDVAKTLRAKPRHFATLITLEMGKPLKESLAEIEKCANVCDYYAQHGESYMQSEPVESDAARSYVAYRPLGVILAIMPWNFPFWQVFRAAVPGLMAGNALLLKHAPNVPQCALAIEAIFKGSGLPDGLFSTLMIEVDMVDKVISNPNVHGVTLTGSEAAGRKVAACAGRHLKKCVLELGGSDPFVVLQDADLELTVNMAVASRFMNCGQSCIAAKRFVLVPQIADEFLARLRTKVDALRIGDPMDEATQIGPMARRDLRDSLHRQVSDSIAQGAYVVTGCHPVEDDGYYYQPSILDQVSAATRACQEELFGPVAIIIRALDEADALRIANETRYGLGSSIWSKDVTRAESLARQIGAGCTFINGMVKSDPRLPFGGTRASGYGRELSRYGMHEFLNVQTVWIA